MPIFKGLCKIDGKWRQGSPVCRLGDWVGIQIYNLEKGCYNVFQVYNATWEEVK
jgi:hypothetical protein